MWSEVKVGAVVLAALVALAAGIFLLGERSNLFALKNSYSVRFANVSGLEAGNPVQLNGVVVGRVETVVLPEQIEEEQLTVWISLDRRFADRVREDSVARIKTLGLLGDKYIEISSGSSSSPAVPSDGEIPAAPATDVDRLLSSGEDVVDNVAAISYSLRTLLERMERGEGLLGEMLVDSEAGQRTKQAVVDTFESLRRIAFQIESGKGTLGALVMDEQLAGRVETSIARVETALAALESGSGPLAALLHDEAMRSELESALTSLGSAAERTESLISQLEDGEGLLHRLLTDETYAHSLSDDLETLLNNLRRVSGQLVEGEGSLGQLIRDPNLYQALDDVVVGVDESRFLRWLIRNRQQAGIKKRYKEAKAEADSRAEAAGAASEEDEF
jgi:phospholipid/cholesterol/gamma-HCH transport system substrate-binding protein